MALLPIVLAPDPRLKVKCRPVERVDDAVRRLMDDMLETMYAAPGIGLSAPQVADTRRVMVVDLARDPDPPAPLRMANPEIIEYSDDIRLGEEGCLSLPEHYAEVERPARIRVRYLDHENEIRELAADGLLAACIQHELDHLDGVLFVDHLSPLKRNVILRKMKKAKRVAAAA
jgi:peptide deformylase